MLEYTCEDCGARVCWVTFNPYPESKKCCACYHTAGIADPVKREAMRTYLARLSGQPIWEWICKHCGHSNRGTDSSLLCENCSTPRG
jgi:hypothetical protein